MIDEQTIRALIVSYRYNANLPNERLTVKQVFNFIADELESLLPKGDLARVKKNP